MLFASTALAGVALASPLAAQSVANPRQGGTITVLNNPQVVTVTDNTRGTGTGGVYIGNLYDENHTYNNVPVTLNAVTINATSSGTNSGAHALFTASLPGNTNALTLSGTNSLTTEVRGGAAIYETTGANMFNNINSSGSTLTGSYGWQMVGGTGLVQLFLNGYSLDMVANGTKVAGLSLTGGIPLISSTNREGTTAGGQLNVRGFDTGILVSGYGPSVDLSGGGTITANTTGLAVSGLDAGTVTVKSGEAITVGQGGTGIRATSVGGAISVTTVAGGTIDGGSTGISASGAGGANTTAITVGAAIGGTARPSTGVSVTGAGLAADAVAVNANITAVDYGLSLGSTFTTTIASNATVAAGSYGVTTSGVQTINNAGTIVGGTQGLYSVGSATIVNTGLIGAGTLANAFTANGNTAVAIAGGSLTNGSTGTIGGALTSSAALTLSNAGAMKAVSVTGAGNSALTLQSGSTTGAVTLAAGNDSVTLYNGTNSTFGGVPASYVTGGTLDAAKVTSLNLGGGTNTVTLAGSGDGASYGAAGALALDTVTGLSTLVKTDSGNWTLSGAATGATAAATIYAGNQATTGASGVLQFTNASGLTGAIYQNGATVQVDGANALGSGTLHIVSAAAGQANLSFLSTSAIGNAISLETNGATALLQSGTGVTGTINGVIANGSGTTNIDGQTIAAAPVTVQGGGTIVFAGANTYTGLTTVTGAGTVLSLAGGNAIADTNAVQVGNGGTLSLAASETIASLNDQAGQTTAGAVALNSNTLTLGGDNSSSTFSGVISGTNASGLTKTGGGTLTLTGSGTAYTGLTTVSAGTLQIGAGGSSGSVGGAIVNDSALIVNRSDAVTAAGTITGGGTLTKLGGGTLTLTGANSAGGTTVAGGTLAIVNGASLTSDVTVQSGATLNVQGNLGGAVQVNGGTVNAGTGGMFGGTVTLADGATLALGGSGGSAAGLITVNGTGTLSATSGLNFAAQRGLTLGSGSVTNLTLGAPGITPAVAVTGNLQLGGTLNLTAGSGFGTGNYMLMSYSGTLTNPSALAIGTTPLHSLYKLDTSTAHQVSLNVLAGQWWKNGVTGNGSGTWDPTSNNWSDATGNSPSRWRAFGLAIFSGTAGTVTVTRTQTAAGMEFLSNNYTLTGNTVTLTAFSAGAVPAIFTDSGVTATIGSALGGTAGLAKTGTGTLVLTGANTYTGDTTVSAGTLQIGDGGTTGVLPGDVNVASNAALMFNRSNDLTYAGGITGSGTLTKLGGGTLILTGASSYTGGTTISGGTLQLGNGGTSGSILGDVVNNGTLAFNRSDSLTFSGAISGSGGLVQEGTGTLTLTGANSYSGATTVSAGTLALGGGSAIGDQSAVSVATGAILALTDAGETIGSLAGGGAVNLNGNCLTTGGNGTSTSFSGTISGSGGCVTKTGTGTLTLTGANSYTGGTTISGGTLQIGDGGSTGVLPGDVNVASNAALVFNRSNDLTYAGVITGSGTLTKTGGGTLTLTGASSYTGGTTISGGTLQIGDGTTNGNISANSVVTNNGTLVVNTGAAPGTTYTFGASVSGSGTFVKKGNGQFVELTGAISNTGGVSVQQGRLVVGNTGSVTTDVTVASGTDFSFNRSAAYTFANAVSGAGSVGVGGGATITVTGALNQTGGTVLAQGSVLQIGNGGTTGSLAGDVATDYQGSAGTLAFNRSDALTFGGAVSGAGGLSQIGTGTTTLTGSHSYTGETLVAAGTLVVSGGTSSIGVINVGKNASTTGALTLTGSGTSLTTGANLATIGANGTGSLSIGDGAQFTSNALILGEQSGATGTATLSGTNARLTVSTYMKVGNLGTGSLTLSNGATATVGGVSYIGDFNNTSSPTASGSGSLTLRGAGTLFTTQGLYLRNVGSQTSSLRITDGAVLENLLGLYTAGNNSTIYVNGANSALKVGTRTSNPVTWNSADGWFSPDGGQIEISGGALLDADGSYIGGSNTATMLVTGAGTRWLNGLPLYIGGTGNGNPGNGTVTVSGGAYVKSATSAVGVDTGAVGNLTITGTGTIYEVVPNSAAGSLGNMRVGFNGTGTVTVSDGALLRAANQINIATNAGSVGVLSIGGAAGAAAAAPGTLDGGTLGIVFGDGSGKLVFNHTDTAYTFAQTISGTGQVVQQGPGTTMLTGANSYTGGTTISGGTLQIGDGGTTGVLPGDVNVASNAALVFNRSNDLTYAGVITGSGTLTKTGGGTLTLTGSGTAYTGLTTVSAGTLQIGDGGSGGSVGGAIVNDSALIFNRSDAVTAAGTITGGGTLTKLGGGTLTLVGANSAGGTTVTGGTLAIVNGASLTSDVTVQSGATLSGSSSGARSSAIIGTVTVQNGGTITVAPTSGPGVSGLSMTGLALASGANVNVTLGANSTTAPLSVGTLTLGGTLNVANGSPNVALGVYRLMDYTTLAANNGMLIGSAPSPYTYDIEVGGGQVNLSVLTTTLQYWNGTTTAPGGAVQGGAGTWSNTSPTNWLSSSKNQSQAWGSTYAVFAGAPGAVAVSGGVSVTGMQFMVDGYTVDGSTIALAAATGQTQIRVGDGTDAGAAYVATIGSVLTGSTGLEKTDLGTLILTGASSYTGGTTISGGTLQLGNGGTSGSIVGDVVNNGTLAFNRSDNVTYSGAISGSGGLVQEGTGTLTLTGTNSYSGATTVSAGTLALGGGSAIGDQSAVSVATGAILALTDAGETIGSLAGGGAVNLNGNCLTTGGNGTSTSFSGTISGSGGCVTKTGTGTLTLTGANSFTGPLSVTQGTVAAGAAGALGTGTLALSGDGTFAATGTFTATNALTLTATGAQASGGGTFQVDPSQTLTLSGAISGTGALTKTGTGTLVLTGANNSYGGPTGVTAGILIAQSAGALGTGGAVTVAQGAQLILNGSQTIGSFAGAGQVTLNADLTMGDATDSLFSGALSGTGGLTKAGTGTLTLSGANSYSGATNVSGGTLAVTGSLTDSDVTVQNGATLAGTGSITKTVHVLNGGTLSGSQPAGLSMGGLTMDAGATMAVALGAASTTPVFNVTGNATLAGNLAVSQQPGFGLGVYSIMSVGGTITNNGMTVSGLSAGYAGGVQSAIPGQVNLLVENPDSPTAFWNGATTRPTQTVAGGAGTWAAGGQTNWINASGTIARAWNSGFAVFQGTAGAVTVDASGGPVSAVGMQFMTSGYTLGGAALTLTGVSGSAGVIRVGNGTTTGAATVATIANALAGTAGLEKADYGTLILTGASSYAGGTTISGGTLQLGNGGTGGSILGNVANNATLAFNRSDNVTFSGVISGSGTVVKAGAGTLTLTGANSYTGGTTISGGTLQIGDGGTTGVLPGDVNVASNAALVFNRSNDLTYAGVITGSGTLTKTGGGTLTLTGSGTAYTGLTTVSAGTLQIGDGGSGGSVGGAIVNDSALIFNRSDAVTAAGTITGGGTLTKLGGGTLTLVGANSAGGTTVTGGTLAIVNGASLTSDVTVQSGATLSGSSSGARSSAIIGTVTVQNGGTITVAPTSGPGVSGLSMTGLALASGANVNVTLGANSTTAPLSVGTLTLGGTLNVANGSPNVALGVYRLMDYTTLAANNGMLIGSAPSPYTYDIEVGGGQVNLSVLTTTLQYWNGTTTAPGGAVQGGAGTWSNTSPTNWLSSSKNQSQAWGSTYAVFAGAPGAVAVSGGVSVTGMQFMVDGYTVDGSTIALAAATGQTQIRVGDGTDAGAAYVATIGSVLTGSTGLEKTDLGTLILTGASSYTGGTTISGGTLQLGNGGTSGSIVGDVVNNGTLAFNRSDNVTYSGAISGSGGLVQEGTGTLTLTGTNSYSGATTVSAGTLALGGGSAIGDQSAVSVATGAILALTDAGETIGSLAGGGAVNLNGNCLTTGGNGTSTSFSGTISGSGGCVTKTGTGTLTLTGANSFTGPLSVTQGTVAAGAAGALGTGTLALSGDGTFAATGTFTATNALTLTATGAQASGGGTFQVDPSQTLTLSGAISGTGALTKTGTGTLVLTGANNSYGGPTGVTAGILIAQSAGALGTGGAVTVAQGAQLILNGSQTIGSFAGAGQVTLNADLTMGDATDSLFSGALSGTGGLTKAGTGTLTLSGANSYSGATNVSGGTLAVTGSLTDSDVTVQNGATLAGTGSITKTVHVLNGGTLSGSQPAGLSMGGLTMDAGATMAVALGAASTTPVFNVTGNATLAGNLAVSQQPGFGLGVYSIMSVGGTITNNGMTVSGLSAGYAGGVQSAIPGQVNLLVENPDSPTAFWNGATTRPTQTVAGGAGTWAAGGQTNWINASGTIARAWNSGFAVFQGTAGAVTVDASGGPVSAVGMQFMTSGYTLGGAALTLTGVSGSAGVIRVGNGTTTGAATVATIANALAGTAGLEKADYGTLILTGASSYAGGTTISGGTLQLGNGGTGGSILGNVANNATLAFNRSDNVTFSGVISGSGTVVKAGAGTLTLTGANSYTGGTQIQSGTVQATAANALGTGALALSGPGTLQASGSFSLAQGVTLTAVSNAGGGTVLVDPAQTLKLSGAVSGTGGLTKTGAGTLVLTGTNSYAGGTTIAAGTLQIGDGGTSGTIVGNVVNNGTLVFNRSDRYAFTGAISGSGQVSFAGGGAVDFSAPYSGAVAVNNASLVLTSGTTSTSTFSVNSGGTISGVGTIGGLVANAGATVSPGYSPGTLTVSGPVTFNNGSIYHVDVTPAGAHDLILASGAVTLSSGATVQVAAVPGRYASTSKIAILTTSGTISGTFGSIASDYAFLKPVLSYDPQNVYITLTYTGQRFADYAVTRNQTRVAGAAQALGSGNGVYEALMSLSTNAVAPALNQLTGEAYASTGTVIQNQSIYLRDAVLGRMRQGLGDASDTTALGVAARTAGPATARLDAGSPATVWMQGYGGWGNAGGVDVSRISGNIGGFFMGLDAPLSDTAMVGVLGGFSQSTYNVAGLTSNGRIENYDFGAYAGAGIGPVQVKAGASYSLHDLSGSRQIAFPGFTAAINGHYTQTMTQAFGEASTRFAAAGVELEPFAGLAHVHLGSASTSEGGSSAAALSGTISGMNTTYSTVGLRAAASARIGEQTVTPSVTLGWQHAFGDLVPRTAMRFASGATMFTSDGVPIAQETAIVKAGLAYRLSGKASIQANYLGQIGHGITSTAFNARLTINF